MSIVNLYQNIRDLSAMEILGGGTHKMKTQISILLILACLAALAGCGGNEAAVPSSGVYRMEVPEDKAIWAPMLSLDPEEQHFLFYYDQLSAWLNSGTYRIEGDLLIAANNPITHDERQFVFRIVDSKTLAFVEDQSSPLRPLQDERFGVPLYDGARFVLKEEEPAP